MPSRLARGRSFSGNPFPACSGIDVVNAAGAPTAQADIASYDSALDFNDLIVTGTQEITVTASGDGDVLLTFLNGGTGIGSVELNNVTFGTGAGQYDTVQDLTTGGGSNIILEMTGDGFHTGL